MRFCSSVIDWGWVWVCASPSRRHGKAPLPGQKPINLLESPAVAWIAPNAKEIFHWPVLDPESCHGLSMGRGGCDRQLCGDPYRCSEEQSKKHPSHQDEKGPASSPWQIPPADHAAPGDRRQNEDLQVPARWGSHRSLAASLVRGPCSSWGFSSREVGITFCASGRDSLK